MRCAITRPPGASAAPAARRYDYFRPTTLDEAFELKRRIDGARFVAGGTDVMVRIKGRVEQPAALISLRGIEALRGVELGAGGTRVGAATTIAELLDHAELCERYPGLSQAARLIGSAQIRSVATLGGNLGNASPCADTAPPLLTMEARLELVGPDGSREVGIEELFVGPGQTCLASEELIAALLLPPPNPDARELFQKKRRVAMDLALASVAIRIELDGARCRGARIAAGSVAPTPVRLKAAETALEGEELSDDTIAAARLAAVEAIAPIDDIRASADYRRQIVGVYVQRGIKRLMTEDG